MDRARLLTEIYREGGWNRLNMISEKAPNPKQGWEIAIFSSVVTRDSGDGRRKRLPYFADTRRAMPNAAAAAKPPMITVRRALAIRGMPV